MTGFTGTELIAAFSALGAGLAMIAMTGVGIGIGYNADLKKAKAVCERLLEAHENIINEDGIQVVVESLGESSVNLSVRGWTKTENYWSTRFDLLEQIKLTFDEEGIEIPFNYLNVNIINNQ